MDLNYTPTISELERVWCSEFEVITHLFSGKLTSQSVERLHFDLAALDCYFRKAETETSNLKVKSYIHSKRRVISRLKEGLKSTYKGFLKVDDFNFIETVLSSRSHDVLDTEVMI